jgi:hypothetical protein
MSSQPAAARESKNGSSQGPARRPGPAMGNPAAAASDWASRRRAAPLNVLLNSTVRWAASLPTAVRPQVLMDRFPRLANLVAASWKEPLSFRACLDDLLTDRRGGRQGLPPDVRDELENLRRYYYFRESPTQTAATPASTRAP